MGVSREQESGVKSYGVGKRGLFTSLTTVGIFEFLHAQAWDFRFSTSIFSFNPHQNPKSQSMATFLSLNTLHPYLRTSVLNPSPLFHNAHNKIF